jgi:hypothetical protein
MGGSSCWHSCCNASNSRCHRTVTSLADNEPGSLRDTITASIAGHTIDFAVAATISLTDGEMEIGRDLTVIGAAVDLALSAGNVSSQPCSLSSRFSMIKGPS